MKRAFSLLEVLVAAALLGLVVAACLPMLRPTAPGARVSPDRRLTDLIRSDGPVAPPNATIEQFESRLDHEIDGVWIVIRTPAGYAAVWREAPRTDRAEP